MQSFLAKKVLGYAMGRLNAGDPQPLLRMDARDVGRMAWGRMTQYEVDEDTERSTALDAWLSEHEPRLRAVA